MSELGIASEKHKHLHTETEYQRLVDEYTQNLLLDREKELDEFHKLYQEHKRITLNCYDQKAEHCDRHKITHYLLQKYQVDVEHL